MFRLLDLPRELRDRFYDFALQSRAFCALTSTTPGTPHHSKTAISPICHASRQLRAECLPIWRQRNIFTLFTHNADARAVINQLSVLARSDIQQAKHIQWVQRWTFQELYTSRFRPTHKPAMIVTVRVVGDKFTYDVERSELGAAQVIKVAGQDDVKKHYHGETSEIAQVFDMVLALEKLLGRYLERAAGESMAWWREALPERYDPNEEEAPEQEDGIGSYPLSQSIVIHPPPPGPNNGNDFRSFLQRLWDGAVTS